MKPDANQSVIVEGLRGVGATVTILAGVGCGCPDLLVGWHEHNYLLEIKNLAGRGDQLTPAEVQWIQGWKGQVAIIHDIDEALHVLELTYDE